MACAVSRGRPAPNPRIAAPASPALPLLPPLWPHWSPSGPWILPPAPPPQGPPSIWGARPPNSHVVPSVAAFPSCSCLIFPASPAFNDRTHHTVPMDTHAGGRSVSTACAPLPRLLVATSRRPRKTLHLCRLRISPLKRKPREGTQLCPLHHFRPARSGS